MIVLLAMPSFEIPSVKELQKAGMQETLNIFRRFFAYSRYNRLLIQQILVRSAFDRPSHGKCGCD